MENKRKNIYIVIFVITTVIAACAAVYFKVDGDRKTTNLETKIKEQENEINLQNNNNVEMSDVQDSQTIDNSKKEVIYKYTKPQFDASKCLNPTNGVLYRVLISVDNFGISCYNDFEEKNIYVSIHWSDVKNSFGIDKPSNIDDDYQKVTIENLSGKVKEAYILCPGLSIEYTTLFFLMEDGTVEYIPIYKALKSNVIKSYGKLNNIEGISFIEAGDAHNIEGGGTGTAFAIKEDGTFYDLRPILIDTGNYNF